MPSSKRTLLIVDDEHATRTSFSYLFTQLGHSVRSAEDGFSALSAIRAERPGVILSDLNMPGMSGFELLSVVRRRFPAISVIAMSGYFSGDGVQPGVAADAFYEKGTGIGDLLSFMQAIGDDPTPARNPGAIAPIWISRNTHDASAAATVMISCPECLRAFSPTPSDSDAVIQQTDCFYCHSAIHYAIVQLTDPASPQAFQSKPVEVVRSPLPTPGEAPPHLE
jgi:CheY-like chemotaxis protein